MTIMVTGASGKLGRLVVEHLLDRGVAVGEIVATGRDSRRLEDLAARGVVTRTVDFGDPAGLRAALTDVDSLLLVSTTTVGERFDNHRRVIDAACESRVGRVVYTSTVNADSARMRLADEHRRTEQHLRASGIPFTILRNGWYIENYTERLSDMLVSGQLVGAAGAGVDNAASRSDLAEAAAIVLTQDGHAGATYDLVGPGFTLTGLASIVSAGSGTPVSYRDLSPEDFAAALEGAGLPAPFASILADADAGLARGELAGDSGDLGRLLGRAPLGIRDAVREALGPIVGG